MKKSLQILFLCIADIIVLSVGHAYQINPAIILSFIIFILISTTNTNKYLLPIMLFFLPWSPVFKLNASSYSMITLAMPLIFFVFILKHNNKKGLLDVRNIIIVFLLTIITLIVKFSLGYGIAGDYLHFLFMLIFIPIYLKVYVTKINFPLCIVFLSTGAILASAISKILLNYSHMLSFINVLDWRNIGIIRLCGFYGDPNFYSIHFIVAISGLFIMILKCKNKLLMRLEVFSLFVLIYFGIISVSKMFVLVLVIIIILFLLGLLVSKTNISNKVIIILGIVIFSLLLLGSDVFKESINYYYIRFGAVDGTSSLTTGRTNLWMIYLKHIFEIATNSLFGIGLTHIRLSTLSNDAHNILIQILYQVGIVGLGILIAWIRILHNSVSRKIKISFESYIYQFLIFIGFFLPWMALDMLFFNDSFYIIALYFVSKEYLASENKVNYLESKRKDLNINVVEI